MGPASALASRFSLPPLPRLDGAGQALLEHRVQELITALSANSKLEQGAS